jgi:phosphoglycerate kinase
MKLRSVKDLKGLKNKRVLLRVDFNVPLQNGRVKDDWRIRAVLPTLDLLRKKGAKIILISHLGRPTPTFSPYFAKGKTGGVRGGKKFSLKPVFGYLKKMVNFKIDFTNAAVGSKVLDKKIKALKPRSALMLENIRFCAGEEKNDSDFAKKLAGLGDIFVNDAFAVSHRDCSSITGIVKFLPSYAGLNLGREVEVLGNVLKKPKKPMVVLMGGAKISVKIGVIKRLLPKSKVILLGGALANNFLKAGGWRIGDSLYDKEGLGVAKKFLKNGKIIWPTDAVITNFKKVEIRQVDFKQPPHSPPISRSETGGVRGGQKNLCPRGWKIVDIGPRTIKLFSDYIRKAQTIVWNGPMGYFEDPRFSYGTMSMAQVVGARSTGKAFGVVGGGETIEALKKSGMEKYIDWVSTGGGAMLEFLEKGTLPGIKPLLK